MLRLFKKKCSQNQQTVFCSEISPRIISVRRASLLLGIQRCFFIMLTRNKTFFIYVSPRESSKRHYRFEYFLKICQTIENAEEPRGIYIDDSSATAAKFSVKQIGCRVAPKTTSRRCDSESSLELFSAR